jgi:hypothetical protein
MMCLIVKLEKSLQSTNEMFVYRLPYFLPYFAGTYVAAVASAAQVEL